MKNDEFNIRDYSLTLSCAFRYALGRQTYVVGHVVEEILNNWDILEPSTISRFKKEILQHMEDFGNLGGTCDYHEWMKIVDKPLPKE